jgi:hypothetical protein
MANGKNVILTGATVKVARYVDCVLASDPVFVDLGYLKDGITIKYEPDYRKIKTEQACAVSLKRRATESFMISMNMLEVTIRNLGFSFGYDQRQGEVNTSIPGGFGALYLGDLVQCQLPEFALMIITGGPCCRRRVWEFLRTCISSQTELKITCEEEQTLSVELEALKTPVAGSFFNGGVAGNLDIGSTDTCLIFGQVRDLTSTYKAGIETDPATTCATGSTITPLTAPLYPGVSGQANMMGVQESPVKLQDAVDKAKAQVAKDAAAEKTPKK